MKAVKTIIASLVLVSSSSFAMKCDTTYFKGIGNEVIKEVTMEGNSTVIDNGDSFIYSIPMGPSGQSPKLEKNGDILSKATREKYKGVEWVKGENEGKKFFYYSYKYDNKDYVKYYYFDNCI
ncbi:TPA: hypothetical protein JLO99_002727 [Escherichia coli]|nr:hypothetical protein [Escherichia coli]